MLLGFTKEVEKKIRCTKEAEPPWLHQEIGRFLVVQNRIELQGETTHLGDIYTGV